MPDESQNDDESKSLAERARDRARQFRREKEREAAKRGLKRKRRVEGVKRRARAAREAAQEAKAGLAATAPGQAATAVDKAVSGRGRTEQDSDESMTVSEAVSDILNPGDGGSGFFRADQRRLEDVDGDGEREAIFGSPADDPDPLALDTDNDNDADIIMGREPDPRQEAEANRSRDITVRDAEINVKIGPESELDVNDSNRGGTDDASASPLQVLSPGQGEPSDELDVLRGGEEAAGRTDDPFAVLESDADNDGGFL